MAIEHCGHVSAWADIASLNGLAMTDSIAPGQELALPEEVQKRVVLVLLDGGWHPAAGFSQVLEGIDYWGIQYDFTIS